MSILKFTAADKLASTVIESGWYTGCLHSIDGPKASASGKSVNFFNDVKITQGPFAEKIIPFNMTTGSDKSSVLGTMQWNPHTKYMDIWAAVYGKTMADVPESFDTEELLHKEMDFKVEKIIAEGFPMNVILGFLPKGKAAAAGSVPF